MSSSANADSTSTPPPATERMRRFGRGLGRLAPAFGAGVVFAASAPPLDLAGGIFVGLVGFALTLDGAGSGGAGGAGVGLRGAGGRGFAFGVGANLVALRFVPEVIHRFTSLPTIAGVVALFLLSLAQALPWAVAGLVARLAVVKARAPSWLAFAVAVYAATFVPAVFPWTPCGGLAGWPIVLQTAELVGERGTSLVIAAIAALVADAIRHLLPSSSAAPFDRRFRRATPSLVVAGVATTVLFTYGALRMRRIEAARADAPHARIALLEPDFDAFDRWNEGRAIAMMTRLSALTKHAEESGAELTVWPESAYPYTLAHGIRQSPRGARAILQGGAHGPVLTGAYLAKGGGLGTNAAILARHDGSISASYDKRHLLWFGETVPLADWFPFLRRIFSRGTGLVAGTEEIAFEQGAIVAAVLNCYEDTLPAAGREAMTVRPNLLVNVTNDAWFAGSAEGELHLRLAVLRAIETRRDLVRAVNRGPTSWVDANGIVRARREGVAGLGPPAPLLVDAALLDTPVTLYTRAGDAPLVLVALLALGASFRRAQRRAAHAR